MSPSRPILPRLVAILALALATLVPLAGPPASAAPNRPVKLVFVHHSVGENWLSDDQGALGQALGANNYFVSDTNYGWGPDSIGDRTDIPNWPEWFVGAGAAPYRDALFAESGQNSGYTRTLANPGGVNEIVMFKSCFPNSSLAGNPNDPPANEGDALTVANAKYVYNRLLTYFATRPDKLFVVVTAPPNSETEYGANARAFNNWLLTHWRQDANYTYRNVAVFDFYNVLTGPNNHHRLVNGTEQHVYTAGQNNAYYRTDTWDDHPNVTGSRKATTEFVPLLNQFYDRWKAASTAPTIVSSTGGNTTASVAFTPPPTSAGVITNYQYSVDGGPWIARTPASPTSPLVVTGLTNGRLVTVRIRAVTALGAGTPSAPVTARAVSGQSALLPRAPVRIADTRAGSLVAFPGFKQKLAAGGTLPIPVGGPWGVPAGAGGVVVNVTAIHPESAGHLRVYPCGMPLPNASTVNFVAGDTVVVPNLALSGLGVENGVCVYSSSTTDLVVDIDGWLMAGRFVPLAPQRAAETRPGFGVAYPPAKVPVAAGQTLRVPVAGRYGVPAGTLAAALNVTAVAPQGAGHLRVFACNAALPNASNVNFVPGRTVANAVVSALDPVAGEVCVYAAATTDVVVDVTGYFTAGYNPTPPARLADTRVGSTVPFPATKQALQAGSTLEVPVTTAPGVAGNASAVSVNVTVAPGRGAGHLRVFPCGEALPTASSVNYVAGQTVANAVVVGVGTGGKVCVYAAADAEVVVDLNGWFPG